MLTNRTKDYLLVHICPRVLTRASDGEQTIATNDQLSVPVIIRKAVPFGASWDLYPYWCAERRMIDDDDFGAQVGG